MSTISNRRGIVSDSVTTIPHPGTGTSHSVIHTITAIPIMVMDGLTTAGCTAILAIMGTDGEPIITAVMAMVPIHTVIITAIRSSSTTVVAGAPLKPDLRDTAELDTVARADT